MVRKVSFLFYLSVKIISPFSSSEILIHRQSGKTFSKIVQDCKMMRGKELLESTSIPISQICGIIGYTSPEHFSRIFKKEYQVSPSDYRKSIDFSCGNEKSFEES